MIIHLNAPDRERIFDDEVGRFVETSAIPCHQCGVCCERWQPLVGDAEVERLATYLDMSGETFRTTHTEAYPFDDAARLLRQKDGACVFLAREPSGHRRCSVHPARPDVCRSWTASLDRRECVDGLKRFAEPSSLVPIATIYTADDERGAFARVVRGPEVSDGG